ncbi:MAG: DUF721 domain-containing protein [Bacteroidales bacterium]
MKKGRAILVSEILRKYLKGSGLDKDMKRIEILMAWDEISGVEIKDRTQRYFKDGVLYVTVNSSMLRTNLYYQKEGLLRELNSKFTDNPVHKIVLK